LDEHLTALFTSLHAEKLRTIAGAQDCERDLDIAVMFDTANCSYVLSHRYIDLIAGFGINISVSCYPCETAKQESL